MFYALFRYKTTDHELKDYREFPTEEEITEFLAKHWNEIAIDKLIEVLAELKFGLSVIGVGVTSREMEFVDTSEEAEASKVEEENLSDAEIIKQNKEALDHADKAIAAAADDMKDDKKKDWKICSKCKVNKVAPWNKKKICSKCQKPPGKRKYTPRKKPKID